jgi:ABC-type multidrug transport system ATPase subunit
MITIRRLTKTYRGGVTALDHLDLDIPYGMFGLLGANGAGKTTLMRILAGILPADTGTIHVGEHDLATATGRQAAKRELGYLPQELGLYPDLTASAFLDYMAILKGLDRRAARRARVIELLDLVGLADSANRKLKTYSGGMKRRVGIAQALLAHPRLLIVDEPTAGLDPEERIRFRTLLTTLGADRTVLLSTHIVEDIASTCRQLAVLGHGSLLYHGETAALSAIAQGRVWVLRDSAPPPAEATVVSAIHHGDTAEYRLIAPHPPRPSAQPATPGLEDGYIALMQDQRQGRRPTEEAADPAVGRGEAEPEKNGRPGHRLRR